MLFVYLPYIIAFLLYRVLLTFAVASDIKNRDTNSSVIWIVLTIILGAFSALTYAVFTPKKEEKNKANSKKSILFLILCIFLIVAVVVYTVLVTVPKTEEYNDQKANSFSDSYVTFTDDNGNEVVYDKMGNSYTFDEYLDSFTYYSKDGLTYTIYSTDDEYGYICNETQEKYVDGYISDYDLFIGEDGYFYIFDSYEQCETWNIYSEEDEMNDFVYYTKDGMIMYKPYDCYWNKAGELVFEEYYKYANFKFDLIPEKDKYWIYEQ